MAHSGTFSLGLSTKVLPHASATGNIHSGTIAGKLNGVTFGYEYTSGGKAMAGRIYYLQPDNRTVYTLRFTGLRDRLQLIRNQTDAIARSFHLK